MESSPVVKRDSCLKVEDQRQEQEEDNQSGSFSHFNTIINKVTDMSSVSNLEGLASQVQKRFEMKPPTLLLNSPTFNTLDNRFEQLNPDSSRIQYGGLGATGSREEIVKNVFTNSTWPGLKNVDSNISEPPHGFDDAPRLASPNVLELFNNEEPGHLLMGPIDLSNQLVKGQRNNDTGFISQ